jgi:AraC family transcriptional regulator
MAHSETLKHPISCIKPEWVLTRQSLGTGGLIVEHHIEPADEVEVSGCSHHILTMLINGGERQVTRFDGREYDGTQHQRDFWLLPASASGFFAWEGNDECLLFFLDPHLLQQTALETGCFSSCQVELLPISYHHDSQLSAIATLFFSELTVAGSDTRLYQESLTNLFTIHLLRNYCAFQPVLKQYTGGLSALQLQQVVDYIHTHLSEDISLNALAAQVHLSVYYFGRLFRQSTGKTPYQYVLECRIQRAKQLLRQTNLNVIEVSVMSGFQNQSNFTVQFRKAVGMTPKQFRECV